MPREPTIAETGKQRSLRVPLDHYRRPNPLVRGKYWITLLLTIAALFYVGWLMLPTATAQRQISPGPLAAAHAGWNNDCAACHQNLQPLRSDSVSLIGLFRSDAYHRESLDQACIKCHNTPVHHAGTKADDLPSCATCHRDHRGAAADIVRPSDAACLGCHRDIEFHRTGPSGLNPQLANIKNFAPPLARSASEGAAVSNTQDVTHPDFRSLKADPGNIKFNHWLHLQPGLAPAESKKKLKASDIPEPFQKQYAGYAKPDGLVQLDCAACHQPDRNGAYMQPIAFEQHCQACHPLAWKFADDQPATEVPHGLTTDRLAAVLDGLVFAAEARQSSATAPTADETGNLPLVPGKTLGKNLAGKIGQDLLGRRNAAARAIATKCQECHIVDETKNSIASDLPDFRSSDIPAIWLRHAKFDHSSHRHVECRSCHNAAYAYEEHDRPQFTAVANGPSAARDHEQVMIAGLVSCTKCHAPAHGKSGGARFDCAECHRYHGGDATFTNLSFPGSSLGTHYPQAPASSASSNTLAIRLVSNPPRPLPPLTGTSTCASAGCHGNADAKSAPWQSAFNVWASRDPHAEAYQVLFTFRGREMTRLLSQKSEPLTDSEHVREIEQRCVGCHATPAPASSTRAEHFSLGVQCESCHGPAGEWLHGHDKTRFERGTAGFFDTKRFNTRVAVCLNCHIGPSDATGSPQAVDHDLIAAGHPRLSFEFHAYYESLPAHWDRQQDEARPASSNDFHYRLWRQGQDVVSTWPATLEFNSRPGPQSPMNDFVQLECARCHHALDGNPSRLQAELKSLPSPEPPWHLPPPSLQLSPKHRLALVSEIFSATAAQPRWDGALQAYLAAKAITADPPINKMADWKSLLGPLNDYLSRDSFPPALRNERKPTTYDSPSDFDPTTWRKHIAPLLETLRHLEFTNN